MVGGDEEGGLGADEVEDMGVMRSGRHVKNDNMLLKASVVGADGE